VGLKRGGAVSQLRSRAVFESFGCVQVPDRVTARPRNSGYAHQIVSLPPGTRLGPYEIASPIGAGGMGEVYRASDTRLSRDVAIKVLPAEFAREAQLRARFGDAEPQKEMCPAARQLQCFELLLFTDGIP